MPFSEKLLFFLFQNYSTTFPFLKMENYFLAKYFMLTTKLLFESKEIILMLDTVLKFIFDLWIKQRNKFDYQFIKFSVHLSAMYIY